MPAPTAATTTDPPAADQPRRRRSHDVAFSVPCVHRLRFTDDVLGADRDVLHELLVGEGREVRVQLWLDADVAAAADGLKDRFEQALRSAGGDVAVTGPAHTLVGGEACKNDHAHVRRMLAAFHDAGLDRRSYVVVAGGGAVLDAVGYAAAVAHRGIRLVRLPTTTLGQADSGVGVKNAVNLFGKKNWQGTFAVPWAVVNDTRLLDTLPPRDWRAGFSEAVKVFLLKSRRHFDGLCASAAAVAAGDRAAALPVIADSALWHLKHITAGGDPFEAREARPLDYGHWSAHRLEPLSGYRLRHGEAVGIGVAIDTVYSSLVHGLPAADADRTLRCLRDLGLPLADDLLADADALFEGLEEFRQHLGGRLTLTMLRQVGQPIDVHEIDRGAMRQALARVATAD